MIIRLDKFLADLGYGTRKEVKKLIRKSKAITINGVVITCDDYKVDTTKDEVYFDDQLLVYEQYYYFMLNKPAGYISAREDSSFPTVIDLIDVPDRRKLFPVGRLDIDTTGLLIITNDGLLAHNNLSPKKHVFKEYFLTYDGTLLSNTKEMFENGIKLDDTLITKPASIELLDDNQAIVRIREGKFHQVKRMIEACNGKVTTLKRIKFGDITLDESLSEGEYRPLTDEEIESLRNN